MAFIFTKKGLLTLCAAAAYVLAIRYALSGLAWVCLVPLFIALWQASGASAFRYAALFGALSGIFMLYWMPALITDFAGSSASGIIVFLIGILLSAAYYGLLGWLMQWLPRRRHKPAVWLPALWVAGIWTLGEWVFSTALPGMPWFGLYRAGNALLDNLYAIQAASLGGAYLLSFVMVLVNYLFAAYIAAGRWKMLAVPLGLLLAYLLGGYGLLAALNDGNASDPSVSVAILCDNTPPGVKWNEQNGPGLVKKLLRLNREAMAAKPDLVLWSESVVPWTYRPDDDFLKAVLASSAGVAVTHVVGLTTDYSDQELYNSAYSLAPEGRVLGRYDKHYPVSLAEKPIGPISLSLSSAGQRFFEKEGDNPEPLPTLSGKAGVFICNDATVPGAALSQVRRGAAFLLCLSNDSWFSHVPFLVRQHFLNTRLRAVEVRRDLVINCNMGTSGLITAGGRLQLAPVREEEDTEGFVMNVALERRGQMSLYAAAPLFFIYIIAALLSILVFIHVYQIKKTHLQ